MDRKEAIKMTSLIMGGTLFGPGILSVMQGCTAQPGTTWRPKLFSESQAELVTALADTIIPPDDTPGAADLGVPAFIDEAVFTVYSQEQQRIFLEGLDNFNKMALKETGSDFTELRPEQQHDFASEQNRAALIDLENLPGGYPGALPTDPFILLFKELTLLGYFTTETGATEVLQYQQNPGAYRGCEPLEALGGRTWAT